jgi:hypothetical protein
LILKIARTSKSMPTSALRGRWIATGAAGFWPVTIRIPGANEVAEIGLQRPILGKLSGTASIGYSHFAGPPQPEGYAFWSLGAAYDLAPVAILVSYVKTTPEAKALFYNAAGNWRWTGTVIWRF